MGFENLLHRRQIAEIRFDQGVAGLCERTRDIAALASRAVVIVEVIDADDFVAARQQRVGEVAADKAGTASN